MDERYMRELLVRVERELERVWWPDDRRLLADVAEAIYDLSVTPDVVVSP